MAIAHAILACLVECSSSGYDLAKRFAGSVGFFWKATHQQIYRELAKLEEQGWISAEKISQEGRPDKKLYHVTPLGRQQLAKWIAQPSEPSSIKEDLLIKVFAGYVVPSQTVLEELERHRQAHLERLAVYRDIERRFFANPNQLPREAKFQHLTLRCGIRQEENWISWCDEAIQSFPFN